MFSRFIIPVYAVIIVALFGVAFLFRAERDDALSDKAILVDALATAQAQIAAATEERRIAQEARSIAQAQAKLAAEESVKWEQLANELQNMEGGDAPLSDFLSRAAGRLWGQ